MKKKTNFLVIISILMIIALSGCSFSASVNLGNDPQNQTTSASIPVAASISDAVICKSLDNNKEPIGITEIFDAGVREISLSLIVHNFTDKDKVTAKWNYLETNELINSTDFTNQQDIKANYVGFSITFDEGFPAGMYNAEIYLNDKLVETLKFTVEAGAGTDTAASDTPAIGSSNRMIFTSNIDGNYEIYMMDTDGTGLINLTNNPADDAEAIWAPEDEIIFVSDRDGNAEIYVMRLDGTNLVNMTNNTASDRYPSLSPDTDKLAFSSDTTGNYDIYVMDRDLNLVNLTNDASDDIYPTWTPDSNKIIFESDRSGDDELYVMNSDGSEVVNLTNNKADDKLPKVSPDNSKIVFASNRDGNYEIYILTQDGEITRLTDNKEDDLFPVWSPDGSKIAFLSFRDGNSEIYMINSDGSGQIRLTNNNTDDWDPRWYSN